MSSLKPLIFVHPLQDTLKELYKVMQETAENDGIEVYEIDSVAEFGQLFSSVGQSVCLFGNPKKCAQALQAVKNTNKKLHSKMLLLSAKNIPRKTMEKFEKIGLTEAIIEPVAPKTLMYKVRLQLKSISTIQEQEEMNRKFGSDNGENTNENDNKKEIKSKDKSSLDPNSEDHHSDGNHDNEDLYEATKKNKHQESDEDLYAKKKISRNNDEVIDGHMRGKVSKQDKQDDDDSGSSSTDHIESYLKGKTSQNQIEIEDEDEDSDESVGFDDLIDEVKQSLDLDLDVDITSQGADKIKKFEEELEQKKKEQKRLALEQERENNKKKNTTNEIDGHLRGQVKEKEQDHGGNLSSEGKRETIEEDEIAESDSINLDILAEKAAHKTQKSNDDDQDDEDFEASLDLKIDDGLKDEHSGGYRDEIKGPMSGQSTEKGQPENPKDSNEAKIDHIETMIKGSMIHKKTVDEEDDEYDPKAKLDVTHNKPAQQPKNSNPDDIDEHQDAPIKLDIQADRAASEAKAQSQDDDATRTKSDSPDLDEKKASRPKMAEAEQEDFKPKKEKRHEDEATSSDDLYKRSEAEAKKKDMSGSASTEVSKKEHNKADARADKIETHYKGGGNSHKAQEWGSVYKNKSANPEEPGFERQKKASEAGFESEKKRQEETWGSEQKKKETPHFEFENAQKKAAAGFEFDYKQNNKNQAWDSDNNSKSAGFDYSTDENKKHQAYEADQPAIDPGEQTIDYEQLHKEFYHLDDQAVEMVVSEEFLYPDEEVDSVSEADDLVIDQNIITAKPQGFDNLLHLIQRYQKNDFDCQKIIEYISDQIHFKTQGFLVFYQTQKNQTLFINPDSKALSLWKESQTAYLPFWQKMTKPTVMDNSFVDEENFYIYPFAHQGHLSFLGIVMFDKKACQNLSKSKILMIQTILQGIIPIIPQLISLTQDQITEHETKVRKEFLEQALGKRVS